MSTISGKIKSKKVKNGTYGDLIVFQVGASTMSVFANDKKLTQEAKDLIRELQEGDEAEFTTYDSTGKDGKTYTNISGVIKVSRLDYGDVSNSTETPVHTPKPEAKPEGDTKIRSMALAYAKDLALVYKIDDADGCPQLSELIEWAKRFEQYIVSGD